MNTVYLVVNGAIDDYYIIAVYRNAKKAQARADAENAKHSYKSVFVEEWRIEK